MLSSLHKAIFKAFNRFEEHQYSFFLSNKPFDRESEYTSPGISAFYTPTGYGTVVAKGKEARWFDALALGFTCY